MSAVLQFFGRIPFLPHAGAARSTASRAVLERSEPVIAPPPPSEAEKYLARSRVAAAPRLEALEWDGDGAQDALVDLAQPHATPAPFHRFDARQARIRDRYIGARFFGYVRSAADLRDADAVIKAARLMFEEGEGDASLELLDLALQAEGAEACVRLAAIELAFLARDGARLACAAEAFRAAHPDHEAWDEILRLGRALAPTESVFGGGGNAPRDHEHYGPWPHLPNWIRAPWDLTAECAAADFHRAMRAT